MQKYILILMMGALVPTMVHAQGMSEQQMQALMQSAEKMQRCAEQIDQSAMDKIQKRSEAMEAEIKALCAAGKRDEATRAAITYGKELHGNPEMQKMQECAKMMHQPVPGHLFPKDENDKREKHICDS